MKKYKIIEKSICILILLFLIFQCFSITFLEVQAKEDGNNIVSKETDEKETLENTKENNKTENINNEETTKDKIVEENANANDTKERVEEQEEAIKSNNIENTKSSKVITSFSDSNVETIDSQTVFKEDYGWCFKFIEGITTVETSGMTNKSADFRFFLSGEAASMDRRNAVSARLTDKSQKGNIWIKYKNIGTYKGKKVNLKVTLEDWNYLQPARTKGAAATIDGVNYPCVFFYTNKIQTNVTSVPAVDSPTFSYTFTFEDEDGIETKASSLKGHFTFCDIDSGEYFVPISGFDEVYAYGITNLNISESNLGCSYGKNSDPVDKTNWITTLFSKDVIKFTYTREQDVKGNKYRDITKMASTTSRSNYAFLTISEAVAPFENPSIDKEAKKVVVGEEEYEYTLHQFIPGESPDNYYKEYYVYDTLDDSLEFSNGEDIKDIKIYDDALGDLTKDFNIEISGQTITFAANDALINSNDFYNNNIYFKIPVKKKKAYDMSNYVKVYDKEDFNYKEKERNIFVQKGDNICVVENKAKSKIERRDIVITDGDTVITNTVPDSMKQAKYSNIVETYFFAEIYTSAINGTIDDYSSSGSEAEFQKYQPFGISITINYKPNKGYILKSLTVNEKEKNISKYPDSYTISNLTNSKYNVDVVYAKKEITYKINYYKDDKLQKDDTETVNEKVEPTDTSVNIDYSKVNTVDKYKNCRCIIVSYMELSDGTVITVPVNEFNYPETIGNGGEINIYYVSIGTLKIIKTGENLIGDPKVLEGVEFEIVNSDTKEILNVTTNEKGEIAKELPIGTYKIRELKTVQGYRLDTKIYEITIEQGKEQELKLENKLEFILPNSGGKGSFKFIISGCICILISFTLYMNNKRMTRENRSKGKHRI